MDLDWCCDKDGAPLQADAAYRSMLEATLPSSRMCKGCARELSHHLCSFEGPSSGKAATSAAVSAHSGMTERGTTTPGSSALATTSEPAEGDDQHDSHPPAAEESEGGGASDGSPADNEPADESQASTKQLDPAAVMPASVRKNFWRMNGTIDPALSCRADLVKTGWLNVWDAANRGWTLDPLITLAAAFEATAAPPCSKTTAVSAVEILAGNLMRTSCGTVRPLCAVCTCGKCGAEVLSWTGGAATRGYFRSPTGRSFLAETRESDSARARRYRERKKAAQLPQPDGPAQPPQLQGHEALAGQEAQQH